MTNADAYDLYCFLALRQPEELSSSTLSDVICDCEEFLKNNEREEVAQEQEIPIIPI